MWRWLRKYKTGFLLVTDKYENMDPVALLDEVRKLDARINSPITDDFLKGVRYEAAHQVGRWGAPHDRGKSPLDWFWLVGFLAQKATHAAQQADLDKALHHTISTAAALLNWHAQLCGQAVDPDAPMSVRTDNPDQPNRNPNA